MSATKPNTKSKVAASRKSSPTIRSAQSRLRPSGKTSRVAIVVTETQRSTAARNGSEAIDETKAQMSNASQNGDRAVTGVAKTHMSATAYVFLRLASETLEDIERVRVAAENRARALTHPEQKICLPVDHDAVLMAEKLATELQGIEKEAEKTVKKILRQTPLGEWVKQATGVGEKQAGRLLGIIGNPRIRVDGETGELHERTIGQLWAYCGYGVDNGVAPRRKRGEQGNWNPKARMRAYLIAESCMKSMTSPYRKIYEDAREKYADSVHQHPCAQCGKKGKPAEPGT